MVESALTEIQRTVLELFFALPESKGFVLAGGAALVASGLTDRPTNDIDLSSCEEMITGIPPRNEPLVIVWKEVPETLNAHWKVLPIETPSARKPHSAA